MIWKLGSYSLTLKKEDGSCCLFNIDWACERCSSNLKPADIGKETGSDEIIVKLDAVCLKDENTRAYVAFKEFYEFKRAGDENFSEYILSNMNIYITN